MAPTDRTPLWLPPLSLAVCGMLAVVAAVMHVIPFAVTAQAFLLLVILRAYCGWAPMARVVTSMPVPHRIMFVILIGGMIVGHYTLQGRQFFPFVAWEIFPFVREDDPVTAREFLGTTTSGAQVRLLVEQQFPSIVQVDSLDRLAPEATEHLARVLAHQYNEHHALDPVREVALVVNAVKVHPPANESRAEPSCEFLQRYEISLAR